MRSHQPSSWAWKSSGFAKRRPASKLPCRKRWLRSSAPLAWQSPASRITQPSASWPQNARNCLGRAAPRRDRALAIPDQLARQRPQPRQAAAHPERDVRELLREHQRAGERARVGQLTRHDVAAAGLAPADRDLRARLAEIELRQLARAIAGALEAARRRQKPRPQLAQQIVEDRLAAHVAELFELLADHARPTASAPQRAAPRSPRRTARASTAAAAAAHRPAASTRPARCGSCRDGRRCDDGSRAARGPPHASTAGSPPTAPRQATPFPWSRSTDRARSPARPDDLRPRAEVDHFSTGAGGPVFRRRLQLRCHLVLRAPADASQAPGLGPSTRAPRLVEFPRFRGHLSAEPVGLCERMVSDASPVSVGVPPRGGRAAQA